MLTAKQNMIECIEGGNPDRIVNQYEALKLIITPAFMTTPGPKKGGPMVQNDWGVWRQWPENAPAGMPVHDAEHVVIKDIEHWQDYVKAPSVDFPQALWDVVEGMCAGVDTEKSFRSAFVAPGIFEQCHHLGEITATLMNLYEYEDEMHDLIKYLTEYELRLAEVVCDHMKPEVCFHHDDWGGQKTTLMSPSMFEEFFVDPYKEVYGYYHNHGCKYIVHHSDSYAATLVPDMIEMGIDVWQGCFSTNNLPELIEKYGKDITFMGGIENKLVDFAEWTTENNHEIIEKTIAECGNKYFIPCIAQGGPGSVYPGVYADMCEQIDLHNQKNYGFTPEEQAAMRMPHDIMF